MDDDHEFRRFARERILDGAWSEQLRVKGAMSSYFDQGLTGYAFPRSLSLFRNVAWRVLLLELWAKHYLPE